MNTLLLTKKIITLLSICINEVSIVVCTSRNKKKKSLAPEKSRFFKKKMSVAANVLNFTKTKHVLFRTPHSKPPPPHLSLSVNGKNIKRVREVNFLGITYNENLSWKKHMLKILSRIRSG